MAWNFGFSRRNADKSPEIRATIENPTIPVSADNFLAFFGINSANLPAVTVDSALTVPAVWAAVAFMSRTLAALPRHAYRDTKAGATRITGRLETVVNIAPNAHYPGQRGQLSGVLRHQFGQSAGRDGRQRAYGAGGVGCCCLHVSHACRITAARLS